MKEFTGMGTSCRGESKSMLGAELGYNLQSAQHKQTHIIKHIHNTNTYTHSLPHTHANTHVHTHCLLVCINFVMFVVFSFFPIT